jgi:hypothetical protein
MTAKYRVPVIDLFRAHDPEAKWDVGYFEELADAVAFAKRKIDREIEHAVEEERRDHGSVTAEGVTKRYFDFGELPLVMTMDYKLAFDSRAYAIARAQELTSG